MKMLTLYSDKGGVSKTTTAPNLAASLKNRFPEAKVGLMDLCSDHGHLSKRYAAEKEQQCHGAWAIVEALIDPRKKRDHALAEQAVRDAVTLIRVVPGTGGEDGCVAFINVSVELSHNLRGAPVFGSMDTAKRFGEDFTNVIEDILGLDYLIVDLPGMVDDAMVRSVLPHCYAAAVPVDMRSYMNLAEGGVLIQKLKDLDVFISGFLRTFVEEGDKIPAAQVTAEKALAAMAEANAVPVLRGGIPNKTTLVQAIEPVIMEDDAIPEVGLNCMAAQKGINSAQRGVIERAMVAMDSALGAMLEVPEEDQVEATHA